MTVKMTITDLKAILAALLVLSAGCATMGRRDSFDSYAKIAFIENLISGAREEYNSGNISGCRKHCDKAIHELFESRDNIYESEYERLHSETALIRIKANQSRQSAASTIKSDLFPLVWNNRVEKWINYYTGRGRQDLVRCIERSSMYIHHIEKILLEQEVPHDLLYVPIVESGYHPFAKSKVEAVGLWQFMKTTAQLNGLKIDDWVDERRDPIKATMAACKLLKELYNRFGTWELALAAYNYGPQGVSRRIKKWETNDYWEMYLPRETENFVPKIMAVIFIMREPGLFGFKKPLETGERIWTEYTVKDAVDLRKIAEWCGADIENIQHLNPELTQMCTPPEKDYIVRIPSKSFDKFTQNFDTCSDEEKYLSKKELNRRARRTVFYRVQIGDNLWNIARKFRVTTSQIRRWNNLSSDIIYPRQKLMISPAGGSHNAEYTAVSVYKVESGDSLGKIAKKFGTTVSSLKTVNELGTDIIRPGQELKITANGDAVYYMVRQGDTLSKIAEQFKVSLNNLKEWNKLTESAIFPQQKLVIYKHGI
ncbi:MAG: LysM peptidoglycan-binding domain-containing protein [Elusimicrobiota bacterium]